VDKNLVQRSISSITWRTVTSWIGRVILFMRAVLLARLLPVDVFGTLAFAVSIISLTSSISDFGKSSAFLAKSSFTENEEKTATTHFTLSLIFSMFVMLGVILGSLLFSKGSLRETLIVLAVTSGLKQLMITPRRILVRRIQHRRLALIEAVSIIISTGLALGLALLGYYLWALLVINITSVLVEFFAFYVWKPIWKPRIAWYPEYIRYFLSTGPRYFIANLIYRTLDRVDDIWVGAALGDTMLGFYSKAYNFAVYPRLLLAEPIKAVAVGVYAELAEDRQKLSIAFFRINSLLIRTGFLFAGIISTAAPEFILLILGDKWLPMLGVFRLMLVFTLFDPVKNLMESIYIALGVPNQLIKIRVAQLLFLLAGLFTLGPIFGNMGAALAVDGMVILGISLLTWQLKKLIDYSTLKLFIPPLIAAGVGLLAANLVMNIPGLNGSDFRNATIKALTFSLLYICTLAFIEFKQLGILYRYLLQLIRNRKDLTGEDQPS